MAVSTGKIVEQIKEWNPYMVAFSEFRGTSTSKSIAKNLFDAGYNHQLLTVNVGEPRWNALFLASRFEMTRIYIEGTPEPYLYWLLAKVNTETPFNIGVVHVPLMTRTSKRVWLEFYNSLLKIAKDWQLGPCIILGDMNSGLSGLDEETEYSQEYKQTLMKPMEAQGWRDPFRAIHPQVDAPTWFSPKDRGFRLDQAFANPELQAFVTACDYDWGSVAARKT